MSIQQKLLSLPYPYEPLTVGLGTKVYFPFSKHFVCDALVDEIQFVFTHPDYKESKLSIWGYYTREGLRIVAPRLPIQYNAQGWPLWCENTDHDFLDKCRVVNWEVWIDLPVGNELRVGDDVFLALGGILPEMKPINCRERQAGYALTAFIRYGKAWLAKNHKKSVVEMQFPNYRRWPERKVYWRKK